MPDALAIIAALGLGSILPKIVEGIIGWLTGRQDAERRRIRELAHESAHESAKRRMYAEHASELRRMLLDLGLTQADLPPWPTLPDNRKEND